MRDLGNWLLRWLVLALMLVGLLALAVWLLAVWAWECFCEWVGGELARERG